MPHNGGSFIWMLRQKSVKHKIWPTCKQLINLKSCTRTHTANHKRRWWRRRRGGGCYLRLTECKALKDSRATDIGRPKDFCLENRQIMLNVAFSRFYYYSSLFSYFFFFLSWQREQAQDLKENANRHNSNNNNNNHKKASA